LKTSHSLQVQQTFQACLTVEFHVIPALLLRIFPIFPPISQTLSTLCLYSSHNRPTWKW